MVPVTRSKHGRVIQTVLGTKAHAGTGSGRIDAPAQGQGNPARRIVKDFLERYGDRPNDFDHAPLPKHRPCLTSIAPARDRQRPEDRCRQRRPTAKGNCGDEGAEYVIDGAVIVCIDILLPGQDRFVGCS